MRYRKTYGLSNQVRIVDTVTGQLIKVEPTTTGGTVWSKIMGAVTSNLGKELAKTAATEVTKGVATQAGKKLGEKILGKGPSTSDSLIKRKFKIKK